MAVGWIRWSASGCDATASDWFPLGWAGSWFVLLGAAGVGGTCRRWRGLGCPALAATVRRPTMAKSPNAVHRYRVVGHSPVVADHRLAAVQVLPRPALDPPGAQPATHAGRAACSIRHWAAVSDFPQRLAASPGFALGHRFCCPATLAHFTGSLGHWPGGGAGVQRGTLFAVVRRCATATR